MWAEIGRIVREPSDQIHRNSESQGCPDISQSRIIAHYPDAGFDGPHHDSYDRDCADQSIVRQKIKKRLVR